MAYETAKPTAHLESPELVTPAPWALSYTHEHSYGFSVGICVARPEAPTLRSGNCFMTVGLGGPGAVNGSREAVEATAAYVASLPTRVAELEAEVVRLTLAGPVATRPYTAAELAEAQQKGRTLPTFYAAPPEAPVAMLGPRWACVDCDGAGSVQGVGNATGFGVDCPGCAGLGYTRRPKK